jgi:hypothetical protein
VREPRVYFFDADTPCAFGDWQAIEPVPGSNEDLWSNLFYFEGFPDVVGITVSEAYGGRAVGQTSVFSSELGFCRLLAQARALLWDYELGLEVGD